MSRTKHKKELHHEPKTSDILFSLESMPQWIDVLLEHSDKIYRPFIKWYADNGFSKGITGKPTVKQLSKDYGQADSGKITKWIAEAYNDILELHLIDPDLFTESVGIRQHYFVKNYDDVTNLTMSLPTVPRIYEEVRIQFLNAKLGTSHFYVSHVDYEITSAGMQASVWLRGGFANPYRDMLFHRAVFEGRMDMMDKHKKYDFEIDKELLEMYKP